MIRITSDEFDGLGTARQADADVIARTPFQIKATPNARQIRTSYFDLQRRPTRHSDLATKCCPCSVSFQAAHDEAGRVTSANSTVQPGVLPLTTELSLSPTTSSVRGNVRRWVSPRHRCAARSMAS
jgi:hypothetical protein